MAVLNRPLFAQSPAPAGGEGTPTPAGGGFGFFLPMLLVFVIFCFLLIRPQSRQQKKIREMVSNLKTGDEVITTSGIHGRVTAIVDNVVTLEITNNVRIKLEKSSVGQVKGPIPPQKS